MPWRCRSQVLLCCPEETTAKYMPNVPLDKLFLKADGSITLEEVTRSLNRYTTTLHCINSAIIKLGKLTEATKVYRGVAGMALPKQFWEPNQFGVKGGVEPAFMSTTLNQEVAMGYAAGSGSRMGIVLEAQQGMVDRGADISWLSQYPHKRVSHARAPSHVYSFLTSLTVFNMSAWIVGHRRSSSLRSPG